MRCSWAPCSARPAADSSASERWRGLLRPTGEGRQDRSMQEVVPGMLSSERRQPGAANLVGCSRSQPIGTPPNRVRLRLPTCCAAMPRVSWMRNSLSGRYCPQAANRSLVSMQSSTAGMRAVEGGNLKLKKTGHAGEYVPKAPVPLPTAITGRQPAPPGQRGVAGCILTQAARPTPSPSPLPPPTQARGPLVVDVYASCAHAHGEAHGGRRLAAPVPLQVLRHLRRAWQGGLAARGWRFGAGLSPPSGCTPVQQPP